MTVSIKPTTPQEAEALCSIQKQAFLPLYEKYRDAGNPCLRGTEDILSRLNRNNRYFTIRLGDQIVGGIFYRCRGNRAPGQALEAQKYLTGAGELLTGKMLRIDGLTMQFRTISIPEHSRDCRVCGELGDIKELKKEEYEG